MDKTYYLEYYRLEREHWWFRARRKILSEYIKSLAVQNAKILNIGAATGASSEMLSAFGNVTSLEYDKECCEFVKKTTGSEFICASITALPFENESFDVVCAFDVVEHISDDRKAVMEMQRVCKNTGYIVCTVPAYMFLWSHHDTVNHHQRRYILSEFRKLFGSGGNIRYSGYFNALLFLPIAAFRLIDKIFKFQFVRHGSGSDFTVINSSAFSRLCYRIMSSENYFISRKISLPFGLSILLSFQKTKD
jgi:SAM-dependent methyltransferase